MFYAVRAGRNRGIYNTWEECLREVEGYSGAEYKKFKTYEQAENYLNGNSEEIAVEDINLEGLHIYVDGSYSVETGYAGYGIVYIYNGEVIDSKNGSTKRYADMRNVAGELFGAGIGIKWAVEKGYKEVYLHYDYAGIEHWATGFWKCKQEGTINYKKFMDSYADVIKINFVKVKSHSGDYYNDMADKLAKEAVGIIDTK